MSFFTRKAPDHPAPAAAIQVPGGGELHARLRTSLGDVEVVLHERQAPRAVAAFVALAQGGVPWTHPERGPTTAPLYRDLPFHRVIEGFMAQTGDPTGQGGGGPGWRFADELHAELRHLRGALSMANVGLNSNGSQFFLLQSDAPDLDGKHTVFGRVVAGIEVLDRLCAVPTDDNARPLEPVWLHAVEPYRVRQ